MLSRYLKISLNLCHFIDIFFWTTRRIHRDLVPCLDRLYGVKVAHIELEAKLPELYKSYNQDHPENRDAENYQKRLFETNSPDFFEMRVEGYGHNQGQRTQG